MKAFLGVGVEAAIGNQFYRLSNSLNDVRNKNRFVCVQDYIVSLCLSPWIFDSLLRIVSFNERVVRSDKPHSRIRCKPKHWSSLALEWTLYTLRCTCNGKQKAMNYRLINESLSSWILLFDHYFWVRTADVWATLWLFCKFNRQIMAAIKNERKLNEWKTIWTNEISLNDCTTLSPSWSSYVVERTWIVEAKKHSPNRITMQMNNNISQFGSINTIYGRR